MGPRLDGRGDSARSKALREKAFQPALRATNEIHGRTVEFERISRKNADHSLVTKDFRARARVPCNRVRARYLFCCQRSQQGRSPLPASVGAAHPLDPALV